MSKVIIYTKTHCPYCEKAKALLQIKKVAFEEINVDNDPKQRDIMASLSQRKTVPQIFINDRPIGGFDDMKKLDDLGQLDPLLQTSA